MDIIHLLPDAVANQIAAGEVVQRPASVIKELLENSIDAGATQIQVLLQESGKQSIQVIDNGKGMSPTDARMSFERHATSKITQAIDLFSLHTMGFRGEALASIVAVAEVDMKTRRAEDEAGVMLRLAGSKLISQESVVCPVGTNLEVRNLFYNIPARRNFLKSNQTELSNVITELQHVAMANPHVEFTLIHNGVQLFQLTAGNYKQRILQIHGKNLDRQLIPLKVDNTLLQVEGFVSQPEGARKKGALQYFFVNDRYMRHPYFHKAVLECYQQLIPEGSQPNYFIYLQVDPSSIDVNVHPTKTEIKFQDESARWHILQAAIREALGKFNGVPTIDFDTDDTPDIPVNDGGDVPPEPSVPVNNGYNPFNNTSVLNHWTSLYDDFSRDKPSSPQGGGGNSVPSGGTTLRSKHYPDPVPDSLHLESHINIELGPEPNPEPEKVSFGKYLQIGKSFIAVSTSSGLLLFDQHLAHLTVLFDRYFQQMQQRRGVTQQELFPTTIQVTQADVPILDEILPQLQYLGFEIDSLGGGSYAVNGKPASLEKSLDVQDLVLQMIEIAREEISDLGETLNRKLALKLSRVQAIQPGQYMSDDEMQHLIESLYALPDHTYAPDGRKIALLLSTDEISSRF